jgi:hypothetical protein
LQILDIDFENAAMLDTYLRLGVEKYVSMFCRQNGTIHALVLWFQLECDDEFISTCPNLSQEHHGKKTTCWDQMIVPLRQPFHCKEGDVIQALFTLSEGYLVRVSK